jgi:exosome complex component RRP4
MNGPNLRKMNGGQTVDVDATKVPRLIGRGGSMIGLLKRLTRCHMIVGQNGRIWLDGEIENIVFAIRAIKMIEENAHTSRLTERVKDYLESVAKPAQAETSG